jgi:hypothetical protein
MYRRDRPSRTRPLLIDTDGDHVCDNIATTGLPDEQLTALAKAGNSFFGTLMGEPMNAPAMPGFCDYQNLDTVPDTLCGRRSDMRRVIEDDAYGHHPALYALGPASAPDDPRCTGIDWEVGSSSAEGWVCVAAIAKDIAGNIGVSRPLRLCYDDLDPMNGQPSCPMPAPDCTDGCSLRPTPEIGPWNPDWVFDPQ